MKHQVRKRYGLEYQQWVDIRTAPCGICGSTKDICVDHCHTTGRVRGALCRACNAAIGALGDTIEGLMRAVRYLERSVACEPNPEVRGP